MYKVVVTQGNNSQLVKKVLLQRGNWEAVEETHDLENQLPRIHFLWTPVSLPLRYYQIAEQSCRQSGKLLSMNHFENHRVITTKVNLIRTLRAYYMHQDSAYKAGYTVFSTTPTTFILTVGSEDKEHHEFVQRYNDLERGHYLRERVPAKHCKENFWLVKPANMNQGRGIEIFKSIKQIQAFLGQKPINSLWVVQKYIEKPLLYYGRKFDIRVWVIVTGKMDVYFYRKGYIRTSSDEYSLDKNNNYVHLTNNCLQKYGSGYSKFQEGNTLPLETLHTYINGLEQYAGLGFDLERDIVSSIKDMIIDTIVAGRKAFIGRKREFELFGYDFLVDEDLRTWLIEVNTNPYLGVPNDYIKDLLNKMLDDMLKLVADPLFPPKNKDIYSATNDFQLIFSEEQAKNSRSPFTKPLYPIESLAQPINRRKVDEPQTEIEKRVSCKQLTVDDQIKQLIETYPFSDYDPFVKPVNKLISDIVNWELHSEETHASHTKTLKLLQQSKFVGILSSEKMLPQLIKVIDSQSFPTDLQSVVIQTVMTMCKNVEMKMRVASPDMINSLVKVALTMFDQREYKQFDRGLIKTCIKCLMGLAGVYSVKIFIPGETRENDMIRELFMKCNGLSVLLLAEEQEDFKQEIASFLGNLTLSDWEMQLSVLKQEVVETRSRRSTKNNMEVSISQEPAPIEMHRSHLIEVVENKIAIEHQKISKRQRDNRERRERQEQEQLRLREEKEKIDRERKMRAEEYMRRKNNERQKMREQEEKKIQQLRQYEEERKKKLAQQITRRREELKVIRNDSNLKLQRDREKEKQRERERQEQYKRQKYTSQERQRILSQWLQNKKEQSKQKRLAVREQQMMKTKLDQQRKTEMQERIVRLQTKAKQRQKDKDMDKIGDLKDVLPIHVTSESTTRRRNKREKQVSNPDDKEKLPQVPKSPRKNVPKSIPHSDDETEDNRLKKQEEQNIALKCFMNVIRRAIRSRRRDASQSKHQSWQQPSNQLTDVDRIIAQPKDESQFMRTQQVEEKKEKAKAVLDYILSSPYSSFVKKNGRLRQVVEEVERLI